MKRWIWLVVAGVFLATPLLAHHAAEGIVDEEIYAMIDDMVADTPHADLVFDDMGGGMVETTVAAQSLRTLENLIDDGLLSYAAMLDGEVSISIDFMRAGRVELTILQIE